MSRKEILFGSTSLVAALAAFHGLPWCVFLYPGLLERLLEGRKGWGRVGLAAGWGLVFSLLFYHWVGGYGLLAWTALGLARGLPWALYPVPALLWERRLSRSEKAQEMSLWARALMAALGLALVSQVLLLGITGVDWETPAAPLTAWPSLLFPLPWVGLVGIALAVGAISTLVLRLRFAPSGVGLLCLLLWAGAAQLFPRSPRGDLALKVALVQTGFSQDEKWDSDKRANGVDRLLGSTAEAAEAGAELVIWPETAWPYRGMRRRVTNTRKIGKTARKSQVDVLASSVEVVPDAPQEQWLNSVSLVLSSGKFGTHYEKRRLAPFAEYLPLPQSWQPSLRSVAPFSWISRYVPGTRDAVFETSGRQKFGVMICYESMTPSMAAALAPQVDFLVVVTNDAPFRHQQPNEAHFRSAILRAVETQRPVLQAANTGVTGAISSNGTVLQRTPVGFSGPTVQYISL